MPYSRKPVLFRLILLGLALAFLPGPVSASSDMTDLLQEEGAAVERAEGDSSGDRPLGIQWEGEVLTSAWYQAHDSEEWSTTNQFNLKAERSFSGLKLLSRLRIDYQDLEGHGNVRTDFREAYAEYRMRPGGMESLDFSIGKRMLYWGKGDEIRPLDRICPEDLSAFYYYDKNDRKTGLPGVFVSAAFKGNLRLDAFWSPYFKPSRTPGLGSYFEPPQLRALTDAGVAIEEDQGPEDWESSASFGARLSFSLAKTDVSLYASRGFDPMPTYTVQEVLGHPLFGVPLGPVSVAPIHPRITFYGLDFERVVGPVVVRGEVAYLESGNLERVRWDEDPLLLASFPRGAAEKKKIQYVAGLDKTDFLFHNLHLNLQYVGEYLRDHEEVLEEDRRKHGMTATLQYTFLDSRCGLKWRFVADFSEDDHRHLGEVYYKPFSWGRVVLGGIFYGGGDEESLFGPYRDKDYLYTRMEVVF